MGNEGILALILLCIFTLVFSVEGILENYAYIVRFLKAAAEVSIERFNKARATRIRRKARKCRHKRIPFVWEYKI